jgi:hypothetical protein
VVLSSFKWVGYFCIAAGLLLSCSSGTQLSSDQKKGASKDEDERPDRSTQVSGAFLSCVRSDGASTVEVGCSFLDPARNHVNVASARYEGEIVRGGQVTDIPVRVNPAPTTGEQHFVFDVPTSLMQDGEARGKIIDEKSGSILTSGNVILSQVTNASSGVNLTVNPFEVVPDGIITITGIDRAGRSSLGDAGLQVLYDGRLCENGRVAVPNTYTTMASLSPQDARIHDVLAPQNPRGQSGRSISWNEMCFVPLKQGASFPDSKLTGTTSSEDCLILRARNLRGGRPDLDASHLVVIERFSRSSEAHRDMLAWVQQRACRNFGPAEPNLSPPGPGL